MVKTRTDCYGNLFPTDCELYLDGYLKKNLDDLQIFVEKDWDGIGLISGDEGDGKSVFAMQCGLYLDSNFSLKNIVFTPDQFEKIIDEVPPGSCVVWDEADSLASHWANKILLSLKRKFKTMRDKNLKILLVTPAIFDMNKYFIIGRTRFLVHIYAKGFVRGYFRFFNKDRKKKLYIHGKKEWDMGVVPPNFSGRFTKLPKDYPIDFEEYKNKKHKSTVDDTELKTYDERLREYRNWIMERLQGKISQKEIAEMFEVTSRQVRRIKKERLPIEAKH